MGGDSPGGNDSGQEDTSDSFDANMGLSEQEVNDASDNNNNTVEVSREERMSPGRATAQFGSEIGSVAGGFTPSQVQGAIDNNQSGRSAADIAMTAPIPVSTVADTFSVGASDYVPTAALTPAAVASARLDRSKTKDSQSFFGSDEVPDPSDFNFARSSAAQQLQDSSQGLGIPSILPGANLINALTGLPSQMTLNALNRGQVPTYNAQGQITGTTGQGFGMASPTGSVPGYEPFSPVVPTTTMPMNMNDGSNNNETIIRRNPSDPVQDDPTDPPISDDLASNYLQNPFYLYSGQGNLYQPYGYAANTLVNLLRTRNLTQPQQAAANLGLFGNPGDFV
jgi:hypothetical protein